MPMKSVSKELQLTTGKKALFTFSGEGPELCYIVGPGSFYLNGLAHLQKQFTFITCDEQWTHYEKDQLTEEEIKRTTLQDLINHEKQAIQAAITHYGKNKIGVMGFSAPGALALQVALDIPDKVAWVNGTGIALGEMGQQFERTDEAFKRDKPKIYPRYQTAVSEYKKIQTGNIEAKPLPHSNFIKDEKGQSQLTPNSNFLEMTRSFMPKITPDPGYEPAVYKLWEGNIHRQVINGILRDHFFTALQPHLNARESLKALSREKKVSVFLVKGTDDYVTPMDKEVETELRTYKNVTLKIYNHCGHNPFIEKAERYAADFCHFVAQQFVLQTIRKNPWAFARYLFLFLASLAVFGTAVYLSVLLIPFVTSALSSTPLPQAIISLIALLPLAASITLLLHFLGRHWLLFGAANKPSNFRKHVTQANFRFFSFEYFALQPFYAKILGFSKRLAQFYKLKKISKINLNRLLALYTALAFLTALGLSLYLSSAVLMSLMTAIAAATGVPYVVTGLFAVFAAATLLMLSYELLITPLRLADIFLAYKKWQHEGYPYQLLRLWQTSITLAGMALAGYLGSLIFPWIVNSLLPLLPQTMAIFTAVALCTGLVILTLTSLPKVISLLASGDQKTKEDLVLDTITSFTRSASLDPTGASYTPLNEETTTKPQGTNNNNHEKPPESKKQL